MPVQVWNSFNDKTWSLRPPFLRSDSQCDRHRTWVRLRSFHTHGAPLSLPPGTIGFCNAPYALWLRLRVPLYKVPHNFNLYSLRTRVLTLLHLDSSVWGASLSLFFTSIMLSSYDLTLYFIFLFLYSYLSILVSTYYHYR